MLDIQYIRENKDQVAKNAAQKNVQLNIDELLQIDSKRREMLGQIETLRQQRNELADSSKGQRPSDEQLQQGKELKERLGALESELEPIETQFLQTLKKVPNVVLSDVPVGASEEENVVVKEWGTKPNFDFAPKTHWQIGEEKGWIDKERAAKVAGARFAYLKGDFVKLQWALMQFALDKITDEAVLQQIIRDNNLTVSSKPFVPVLPPLMLKTEMYDAMDRLEPRDDRYKIEGEELWLQGSAEHVMGTMHANEIIDETQFPIRYVGYATSFRKEAGTYGKDTEGIIRMHQFDKLEMESLSKPEDGLQEHKLMVAIQEYLMQQLNIPYRLLNKCTADVGKPNASGWDIDAWMPGQDKYRETHTADYMTDYQARRLMTRVRHKDGKVSLVHTNDATVFSQRPLIAIIENNQSQNGAIIVPEVLRSYMGGKSEI